MAIVTNEKEYQDQIKLDILPESNITQLNRTRNGLYQATQEDVIEYNTGKLQEYFNRHSGYQKFVPHHLGVKCGENAYKPVFLRCWDGRDALDRIIVSSALNIFPVPLQAYGVAHVIGGDRINIGAATIDLNNLLNPETGSAVESMRLDILLHSLGHHYEIESFKDFQDIIDKGDIFKVCTPRAVAQLGLCTIFEPNAIGDYDPNCRNVILIKDEKTGLYDAVIRLDAEANTHVNEKTNQRSGKKLVPRGIYRCDEPLDDYLKTIKSRPLDIDWHLFEGFSRLSKMLTGTRRHYTKGFSYTTNPILDAVAKSCYVNSVTYANLPPHINTTVVEGLYGKGNFDDFGKSSVERTDRYHDNVFNALGSVTSVLPFAEPSSAYNGTVITSNNVWPKLQQRILDKYGNPIEREM